MVTDYKPTSSSIYEKQMGLAEQVAAEQRRLAQETTRYKQQSLADQLEQQRRDYSQQLGLMNEQNYGQSNKLLSGLANRGLATSGLLQLGDVQSQMAKGQGLSQLAYQNRLGQENINRQQQEAQSGLYSALRQAELDKSQMTLGAEESLYNRLQQETAQQQALADRQISLATSLIDSALASGAMTAAEAQDWYMRIAGATTPDEVKNVMNDQEFQQATDPDTVTQENILGQQNLGSGFWGTDNINVNEDGTGSIKSKGGELNLDISQWITPNEPGKLDPYLFDYAGINNALKEKYAGFENYDMITVNFMFDKYGKTHSKPFGIKNPITGKMTWYKTWNEASNAYNEAVSQKE